MLIPNCSETGGNKIQKITLSAFTTLLGDTGIKRKNIKAYINKLTIIAILVLSKKL